MNVHAWCQPRWLLSSLLIAGAALFAIGVTSERSGEENHESTESVAEQSNEAVEESEEGLFGVNLESPVFVIAGVAVSLALAAFTWRSNARRLLIVAGLFAAVFAALDIAESVRKFSDSRPGIGALAMIVGAIHASAAFVADQRLRSPET